GIAREDEGPAAAALAGAFTARADDPSAVFYNPAGILQLDGTRLMVGGSGALPSLALDRGEHNQSSQDQDLFHFPSVYRPHPFSDHFGFGVGIYDPFAQQVEWKKDFPGRFIARENRLRVTALNPVVAFGAGDWSFAVGGSLLRGDATFTRNLDFSALSA